MEKPIVLKFRNLLSTRFSSWVILLVCIAAKSVLIFFYTFTGRDKIYHLSAGYNLLHGKGWTNSWYHVSNLDKEVLEPFCSWPAGYGMLMLPFQWIFGKNFYISTSIFEVSSFAIFLLLCREILKTQLAERAWINISTFLIAFSSHIFIEASLGTDLVGLCFLLGFFYCGIRLWSTSVLKQLFAWGALGGLCMAMAAFIRFLYMPVCLVTGFLLLGIAVIKNRKSLPGIVVCLIIGSIGMFSAMYFQKLNCGSPFYLGQEQTRGVFWPNLTSWYPFGVAAFLNVSLLAGQVERILSVDYNSVLHFTSLVNLFLCSVLLVAGISYVKKQLNKSVAAFPLFDCWGLILCATICGFLGYLSLTTLSQVFVGGSKWTFINEGRYFAFVIVFIQIYFLKQFYVSKDRIGKKRFIHTVAICLLLCMTLNSVHQLYFSFKIAFNFSKQKKSVAREQDYVFFEKFIKTTISENPGKEILVVAKDEYFTLLASMYGAKGIVDGDELDRITPAVKVPTILITVASTLEPNRYTKYLDRNRPKLVDHVVDKLIYMEWLSP